MRILGIDPGLGCTGYAVVEQPSAAGRPVLVEAGAIRSSTQEPLPVRLLQIHRDVVAVLEEFRPAAMALEDLYSEYRFPKTALVMAHARGAICLAAAASEVPVWTFAARVVKLTVAGHGGSDKAQIQSTVAQLLGLTHPPSPSDVADAMALALTAHRRGPQTTPWLEDQTR